MQQKPRKLIGPTKQETCIDCAGCDAPIAGSDRLPIARWRIAWNPLGFYTIDHCSIWCIHAHISAAARNVAGETLFGERLELKRKYDPDELFQNEFYLKYGK